jgi:hypothetical protein
MFWVHGPLFIQIHIWDYTDLCKHTEKGIEEEDGEELVVQRRNSPCGEEWEKLVVQLPIPIHYVFPVLETIVFFHFLIYCNFLFGTSKMYSPLLEISVWWFSIKFILSHRHFFRSEGVVLTSENSCPTFSRYEPYKFLTSKYSTFRDWN